MTSDQTTEGIEKLKSVKTTEVVAVHLEIDGKMEIKTERPKPQIITTSAQAPISYMSQGSREANLRQIIMLQRQLLAQQGQRLQRQQSLIIGLNNTMMHLRNENAPKLESKKTGVYSWLSLFIRSKNSNK